MVRDQLELALMKQEKTVARMQLKTLERNFNQVEYLRYNTKRWNSSSSSHAHTLIRTKSATSNATAVFMITLSSFAIQILLLLLHFRGQITLSLLS